MIYQTDKRLPIAMQKYGCAFLSLAFYRENHQGNPWTAEELSSAWDRSISAGLVSGDLNKDGDLDDPGEATILDWGGLARFLELRLQYLGKFHPGAPETISAYVVSAWFNPANKFVHFCVGQQRPVVFDPIENGSVTARVGYLKPSTDKDPSGALRVFRKLP